MKKNLFLLMLMPMMAFAQNDVVTEVCGVKFGSPYEVVKKELEEQVGKMHDDSDKNTIIYWGKSCMNVDFDVLLFYFEYKKGISYFDSAVFVILCKTMEEAVEAKEEIATALKTKNYSMNVYSGQHIISGGISPTNSHKKGFYIRIEEGVTMPEKYPFEVTLAFGPYDYTKFTPTETGTQGADEDKVIKEVAGIKFGSKYADVAYASKKIFGEPVDFLSKKYQNICYWDVTVDGVLYKEIDFKFITHPSGFLLDEVTLRKSFDSPEEVDLWVENIKKQHPLYMDEKSFSEMTIYRGGISPIDDNKYGFNIIVLKSGDTNTVDVTYGPYGYKNKY